IVDNNSFDGSVQHLKSKFTSDKRIKLIENKINLGFAKANNLGSTEANGKYILILNPDTVLQEDTIEKTIKFYEKDGMIGLVTCKLVLPNGKLDLACRRSFPTPSVAFYRMLGLSRLFPLSKTFGKYNLTYLNENQSYEVDAVCGAFMLIRKSIYEKLGGFDEDYFMYGEDLDFCYRLKKEGYKICYYSDTSAIHFKGESTRKSSISYVSSFYGAMRIFFEKNMKSNLGLINIFIKLSILYRAGISYISRFFKSYYPAFLDLGLIILAMLISIKLRFETFPIEAYTVVIITYSLIWIVILSLIGTYKNPDKLSLIKPFNGILIGFFINSAFTYYFSQFAFSRVVVLRTTAYSILLLLIWRSLAKIIIFVKHKNIFYNDNYTLIVGKNSDSERFVNKLKRKIDSTYNILGYITTDTHSNDDFIGNLNNLKDIVVTSKVKNIIFAKSALSNQQILDMMWNLKDFNLNFKILSGDADIILGKTALDKIDDLYLMQIEYNINKKFNIFIKRIFDLTLGALIFVFIYPLVFVFSKLFNLPSGEDSLFKKILLIPSVLKGDTSFVGRAKWDATSSGKEFLGKKGLTGLVQLSYYKNLSQDELEYYNYYYAKNQSLVLDIEIILKTISLYLFRNKIKNI
ncbi:MAG: glycosyltransferase, partial [Ignavibacteria bacterium]